MRLTAFFERIKGLAQHKRYLFYFLLMFMVAGVAGITYAAFTDKAEVLGSSFTVGSADIKLLSDLSGPTTPENMIEQVQGPSFNGISSGWSKDYVIKLFNNAPAELKLTTNANYVTQNDPQDLRSILHVEVFDWNDSDLNGQVGAGEVGQSYGKKTIIKWKTEGFNLGNIQSGSVRGLLLKFSGDSISDSKQGATAQFDFLFNSMEL